MSLASRGRAWFHSLRHRQRLEADLEREVADWRDELAARYQAEGLPADAALRRAALETGQVGRVKEAVRDVRVGASLDALLLDLRYAWRGLRRARSLTSIIVLTLALAIGANTAIFSIINALFIAPLPYPESSQLLFIWSDLSDVGFPRAPLSGPELNDLRQRSTRFSGVAAIWAATTSIGAEGDPEQLRIGFVTPDFFSVLGVDAARGRTFRDDDVRERYPDTVILSEALWQRRYGSDPSIVGRRVRLGSGLVTVVGVMPSDFRLRLPRDAGVPDDLQAWAPFPRGLANGPRGQKFLRIIARTRPGATLGEARSELTRIAAQLSREFTDYGASGRVFHAGPLQQEAVRDVRAPLFALLGGVVILLAIACVNVGTLLMARAAARSSETTLLLALGASRRHLVRRYLIEGLLLAAMGGLAGLFSGKAMLAALIALRPDSLARIPSIPIDRTVLAFTSIISLSWGALFSLAPLFELDREGAASRPNLSRRIVAQLRRRPRAALVVVEIALGVVLLVSAGLLVRTFLALQRVDPGFNPDGVLSFRIALPLGRTPAAVDEFGRALQDEIRSLPGMIAVGAISHLPYDHIPNWAGHYYAESDHDRSSRMADYRAVSAGFFEAVNARLVDGRFFSEADDRAAPGVVIVDDVLAARTWPGVGAVGRRIAVDPNSTGHPDRLATVVGVVRHLAYRNPMENAREQIYFPARQVLQYELAYAVRTAGDPASIVADVRHVVSRLDKQLPIAEVRPLADYNAAGRATERFAAILAGAFALAAILLAFVGVYGVMAYGVARRRQEFGVRLALGARPSQVIGLVVAEGVRLAVLGLTVGAVAAAAAGRVLQHQLFGVSPFDAVSYAMVVPVFGGAVVCACWASARATAMRSPAEALRDE